MSPMSQMKRAAQESPELSGSLPTAPLQSKWKNMRPQCSACRDPALCPCPLLGRQTQKCSHQPLLAKLVQEGGRGDSHIPGLCNCSSLIITWLLLTACAKPGLCYSHWWVHVQQEKEGMQNTNFPLFGWGYWMEAMAKLPASACARKEGSTHSASPRRAPTLYSNDPCMDVASQPSSGSWWQ